MKKLPFANKDLGQHFLRDQKVISGITSDWKEDCDVIIEVGPGPAILTKSLSEIGKPYFVIEKDERFKEHLQEYVKEENIIFTDALKFDWDQFLKLHNLRGKKIWLVSNLPYNVGTVLFTQFLRIPEIQYMSLMFQKEVGEKTYFRETKNQMNGLLFLSNNYFEPKLLLKVAPGSFTPPPKVDSVVVSYSRKNEPSISIKEFKDLNKFTRLLFSQKRKQIGSVLKGQVDKETLEAAFKKTSISRQLRAETLSYEDVFNLYEALK
jgi:16S rRNA (adenine1518-N6/adenine1519-N6)-dimethyltransferase